MRKSTDVKSLYKNNTMCRQYSVLENGVVDAVVPPLVVADTDAETLDAAKAKNDAIIAALADVEALEAARLVPEPEGDVPKTVTETDIDGNETERPFQAWAEYDAAQVTIAGANELTQKLELVRKGKVSETLPVYKDVEKTITDEEGNESTITESVIDKDAAPIANPDYPAYKAAWDKVNADLN